jgi:hypothetical protein
MELMVFVGLVTACRFAGSPTLISPPSTNAITEGVVLFPSALGITTGSLPSITATQELVVPKSIPIILLISIVLYIKVNSILFYGLYKTMIVPAEGF